MFADVFLNTILYTAIPFFLMALFTKPDWYPAGLKEDGKTPFSNGSEEGAVELVLVFIVLTLAIMGYQIMDDGRGAVAGVLVNLGLSFMVPMLMIKLQVRKLRKQFQAGLSAPNDEDEFERILRHFEYASYLIGDEKISKACADVVPALQALMDDEALRKSYDGRIAMHSIQILGEILDRNHLMKIESWPESTRESFLKGLIGFGEIAKKNQMNALGMDDLENSLEALLAQQAKTGVVAAS